MAINRKFSFDGRIRSIKCAVAGIAVVIQSQHNAWVHALATALVCLLGFLVGLSKLEWCSIVVAVVAVWTAEALNTAIEFVTDLASPGYSKLARNAKDVAAGAVLVSALGAVIIGALVFQPHLRRLFH
jgi:diacylglycerol kinase (ATP)